jgi:valyl-tRNA synthetase
MKNINDEIPSVYDPKKVEEKWYKFWLEKEYFKALYLRLMSQDHYILGML